MGFLDKLREVLKGKSAPEEISEKIDIENVDSWLEQKRKETDEKFSEKSNELHNEILLILESLEKNLDALEEVNVSLKKGDDRIKQATEVGKKDYVLFVRKLLEELKEKSKIEFKKKVLNNFVKGSAKSQYRATLLIGKEIEKIVDDVKKIKNLINNFEKDNRILIEKIEKIKILFMKNDELKKNKNEKKKIEENIEKDKKTIIKIEKNISEIDNEITSKEKSPEFIEKEKLILEIKEKEESAKNCEFEIRTLIDKKILEKYIHLGIEKDKEKFVKKYIENPVEVVLSEDGLKMAGILEDVREKISRGKLTFKEKGKGAEKIKIGKDVFLEFKKRILDLEKELEDLRARSGNIKIDIVDLREKKKSAENQLFENKKQLEVFEKKKNGIEENIERLKEGLEKEEI